MKTNYFLALLFSLAMLTMNAQFIDDFEDCANDGDPISGGHWTDWGCGGGVGCAILCSSAQAHSGMYSGLIPDDGTTDAVLDLGNRIFSEWCMSLYMYVPSNQEAYWNLQGVVPIGSGEWIVGNIFFNQDNVNPGVGLIDDSALGPVNFNFPHDEWFRIYMFWDINAGISNATWEMYVDGNEVLPAGTPFTNQAGDIPTSLGGIDFFSISTDNLYYLDHIEFLEAFGEGCGPIIGIESNKDIGLVILPNPANNILNIEAQEIITSVKIYDILGRLILKEYNQFNQLNVSNLDSGVLFVHIETEEGVITKKIIKK
jgi:hypothetical protein